MLNAKEQLSSVERIDKPETEDPISPPAPIVEPAVADATATNITELIVELAELRQKGLISEEEFQAKKKQLLERL
jgi:hypothetical protein